MNKELYTNWLKSTQHTSTYDGKETKEPHSHNEMLQKVTNLSLDSGSHSAEIDNQMSTDLPNEIAPKHDTLSDNARPIGTLQDVTSYPDTGSVKITSEEVTYIPDNNAGGGSVQIQSTCNPEDHEGEPLYPLDFTELMGMIQRGEQIPGVEELNIEPTNSLPTLSQANSVRKPWET